MLAIALKSLVQAIKTHNSADFTALFESVFVRSVSYLAVQATDFSQHWIVTDLEVRSLWFSCLVLMMLSG